MRSIVAGETNSELLKIYFELVQIDGYTPALSEAGNQPEISINGGSFTATGISVLNHVGYGRYYSNLDSSILNTVGDVIVSRYKSVSTREAYGEGIQVIQSIAEVTPNVISNLSYAEVHEADAFFNNRLRSTVWFDSSVQDRRKSLIHATQLIDNLNFAGEKTYEGQVLQFPRKNVFNSITTLDSYIPSDIRIACYLIAYKLLEGTDIDQEINNVNKVGLGYHQARMTKDPNSTPDFIIAGIPSAEAWKRLKPYLRDVQSIELVRSN